MTKKQPPARLINFERDTSRERKLRKPIRVIVRELLYEKKKEDRTMKVITGEKDLTRYRYCSKCGKKVAEMKGGGLNTRFVAYPELHTPISNQYLCVTCGNGTNKKVETNKE